MFILRNYQGFTLLELLVVLGVTIILTLVSVPTFVSLVQRHRLTATAENFYYELQYARTEAIKRNATVYVSFTTGDNWCYGVNVGSNCNCGTAGSCSLGTVSANAPQQVSISQSGYGNGYIAFEGTHGGANASGSVTFTLYQQTSLITISIGLMGNAQMCSTGIGGYTAC